jgi:hypothetical protein
MLVYIKYVLLLVIIYVVSQSFTIKTNLEEYITISQRYLMEDTQTHIYTNNTIEEYILTENEITIEDYIGSDYIFQNSNEKDLIIPSCKLYNGWTTNISDCDTSYYNTKVPTILGGDVPFIRGDSIECISWKIAASVCVDTPQLVEDMYWYCEKSGGFANDEFGKYCTVEDHQFIYKNNYYNDIFMKNCEGDDVSALGEQNYVLPKI